jgi:hypothetical protein
MSSVFAPQRGGRKPIPPGVCANAICPDGRAIVKLVAGRCVRCYNHIRRYGTERDPDRAPRRRASGVPPKPAVCCGNCKRLTEQPRKGRCHACYEYRRLRSVDRPPTGYQRGSTDGVERRGWGPGYEKTGPRQKRVIVSECVNCTAPTEKPRKGRCVRCYVYRRKHGEDITREAIAALESRLAGVRPACIVCAGPTIAGRTRYGRCAGCTRFHEQHDRDRTAQELVAWREAIARRGAVCVNPPCDRTGKGFVRGRCPACHQYAKHHGGADRPAALCNRPIYARPRRKEAARVGN